MPNGSPSSMRQTLPIYILRMIFEFSTPIANTVNALVCKAWSDEALSVIWEKVELIDLFNLLVPLRPIDDDMYEFVFTRNIRPDDWIRFDHYSWRVRKVRLDYADLDPSARLAISIFRPRMNILPSLVEVEAIQVSSDTVLLLCHSTVLKFSITLDSPIIMNLPYIPIKMPHLTSLEFDSFLKREDMLTTESEADFLSALRRLPSLKSLKLSSRWLTPVTMNAITSLLELKSLGIHTFPGAPTSLGVIPPATRCKVLVDWIGSGCFQLESLSLASSAEDPCRLSLSSFRPILSFAQLKNLELPSFHLHLAADQFVSIFQALPLLERARLVAKYHSGTPSLTISILLSIIPFSRKLESLVVELDASSLSLHDIAVNIPKPFPKLMHLHMWFSPITDPQAVATFLGVILPECCTLDFRIGNGVIAVPDERTLKWQAVRKLLPSLFLARRAGYRQRMIED